MHPPLVLRVRKLLGFEAPGGSATMPSVVMPASSGAADAPEQIFIVQNWTEELKRRVPGARK